MMEMGLMCAPAPTAYQFVDVTCSSMSVIYGVMLQNAEGKLLGKIYLSFIGLQLPLFHSAYQFVNILKKIMFSFRLDDLSQSVALTRCRE